MVGVFILVGIFAICIIGVKISQAIEDSVNNRAKILSDSIFKNRQNELAAIIDKKKVEVLKEIQERLKKLEIKEKYVTDIKSSFEKSFVTGRQWLAQFVGEADKVLDEQLINYLTTKNHPAYSAAEIVKEAKAEKRDALKQAKFLQYQINTYKEYFPFLDEYEELILDEKIDFSGANTEKTLEEVDRTVLLSKEEFEKLSTKEKNQLALDRYLEKHKEKWEIGRFYERYLGFRYEIDKWDVKYIGAIKGFEDMGRDLICQKDKKVHIVQAKCWAAEKTIHEKHIFQLYGTTLSYELENKLPPGSVSAVFATTAKLSSIASEVAQRLGVIVKQIPLETKYAMIKCNLNQGNKIYHLPFDQQYDRVKVQSDGEFYAKTVEEAEKKVLEEQRSISPYKLVTREEAQLMFDLITSILRFFKRTENAI